MKKFFKKSLALVIALMMLISACAFTASAEDIIPSEDFMEDENGVYHIKNESDMLAFMAMAEFYGWYAGKTISLDDNLDMTNVPWVVVTSFRGVFEGNGHYIKGITIESTGKNISMFKNCMNATFKNVRFTDAYLKGADLVSVVCNVAMGEVVFDNVYVHGTVEATSVRPAGFVAYTNTNAVLKFNNCVSDVTCKGAVKQSAGFIAQHTNTGASVEFTDCVFIGDISQADKRSNGFIGLCDGATKMTRCIALGKNNDNAMSGDFMTLYIQNAQLPNKTKLELIDCFGVTDIDTQMAVGYDNPKNYEIYVTYNGIVSYFYNDTNETDKSLLDDKDGFDRAFKYLVKGEKNNFNKDTFKTDYPAFASWVVTEDTVEYAEGKTINVMMPSVTKDLIDGKLDTTPPIEDNNATGGDESTDSTDSTTGTTDNKTEDKTEDKKDDATTEAPKTTEPAATEPVKTEKKGCGSVIGAGAATVMAVAALAVVATRKKED